MLQLVAATERGRATQVVAGDGHFSGEVIQNHGGSEPDPVIIRVTGQVQQGRHVHVLVRAGVVLLEIVRQVTLERGQKPIGHAIAHVVVAGVLGALIKELIGQVAGGLDPQQVVLGLGDIDNVRDMDELRPGFLQWPHPGTPCRDARSGGVTEEMIDHVVRDAGRHRRIIAVEDGQIVVETEVVLIVGAAGNIRPLLTGAVSQDGAIGVVPMRAGSVVGEELGVGVLRRQGGLVALAIVGAIAREGHAGSLKDGRRRALIEGLLGRLDIGSGRNTGEVDSPHRGIIDARVGLHRGRRMVVERGKGVRTGRCQAAEYCEPAAGHGLRNKNDSVVHNDYY